VGRSQSSAIPVLIGIAVVVALVMLLVGFGGAGLRSSSTGSVSDATGDFTGPPADGSYGTVLDRQATETPWNFFGLKIGGTKFDVFIALVPPSGCVPEGDQLEGDGPCEGVAATGTISGEGTTSSGVEFVIVSVRVGKECYAVLRTGDRWPSTESACR